MQPHGVAGFDSAAVMLQATAQSVRGKDFPALGHPKPLQHLVSASDVLPTRLRRSVYAFATGIEGISHRSVGRVDMDRIARWAVDLYPDRTYDSVLVGSSSGAVSHLAAALGAPWLPQTVLVPVRRNGGGIDDPKGDLEQAFECGIELLRNNPGIQLHQMHDPSQDRLSLRYITYFRPKYRRLPPAYRQFLERRLKPGGTIYVSECRRRWPTTRVADRYYFQFGAMGGMEPEEYLHGSERVRRYLDHYGAGMDHWDPPEPDCEETPEAEWGFEQAMLEDLQAVARERGLRMVRLCFDDPEDPSPLVAELHRDWYARQEVRANRLIVTSFILMDPYWVLRTGSVPFWVTFNSGPSYRKLRNYLEHARPYDDVRVMIFPHGTESVGLPSIEDWREVLKAGRRTGAFIGVNEAAYPHHFSALARYYLDVGKIPSRYPLPPPLSLGEFERFATAHGGEYGVEIKC